MIDNASAGYHFQRLQELSTAGCTVLFSFVDGKHLVAIAYLNIRIHRSSESLYQSLALAADDLEKKGVKLGR
jgi:hypothetical protein